MSIFKDWSRKKKRVTMVLTVSVPDNMTAAEARREVRYLINDGSGWMTYQGECVKAAKVQPCKA